MEHGPISFPGWKAALALAALPPATRASYQQEILAFLRYCKRSRAAATVTVIKQYLAWREKQPVGDDGQGREALRWFYREGRHNGNRREVQTRKPGCGGGSSPEQKPPAPLSPSLQRPLSLSPASSEQEKNPGLTERNKLSSRSLVPPPAASDLGTEPWERDLIRALRGKGLLWRTEQTYREWAVRFVRFIAPRSPYAAAGAEVAAFLSALAVEARASQSSQKQALNALVFLMQEALHRDLGEMDFIHGAARRRMPTILSQGECKSLCAQLSGTPLLMVQLAYGSGLRLMELLRLRVHHLDLARLRLQVIGGKGDKDRVTVLPEKLVSCTT